MKNNLETKVLVVGAGPTGLTLAADLARRGIKVKIIEKNLIPNDKSRAIGVQAGTLEALRDTLGPKVTDEMVSLGNPAREAYFQFGDAKPVRIQLSLIDSVYNYILLLHQSKTEKILQQTLRDFGVQVDFGIELVSIKNDGDKVISVLRDQDGNLTEFRTDFAVGCDGAHSRVRHDLQFSFDGAPYTGDFILGDVEVQWPYEYGQVRTFVQANGTVICLPMKASSSLYRIIIVLKRPGSNENPNVELNEFQRILNSISPVAITVKNPTWLTRFRVSHRMTHSFQKGRVFLAGDAAHIHSPAGGQGMNTGIQDALNLSHKLFLFLKNGAPFEVLKKYEEDRVPVARKVLRGTDLLFKVALKKENLAFKFIQRFVLPKIVGNTFFQKKALMSVSQLQFAHKEIRERANSSLRN